ncbi:hypothetical protein KP509_01G085800 [Ceratopteris richardii]|uniref:Uncharacterized protein n=1 Tax=Ceratopteris richardii TaxID=49495 RepID=A0A8T2VIU7_CERRI|nr:hypothetical protein KP509_01G085800 [Ceratopteris richardii]
MTQTASVSFYSRTRIHRPREREFFVHKTNSSSCQTRVRRPIFQQRFDSGWIGRNPCICCTVFIYVVHRCETIIADIRYEWTHSDYERWQLEIRR